MRTFKAFLNNELIILRKTAKYIPLFLIIAVGAVLVPYLNQFNFSGIRFSQEIAGNIAFATLIFGVAMFSSIFVLSSTTFEKTDGMHFFLFSCGINKCIYLIAKLVFPIVLSILGSVLPLFLYYGMGFYSLISVPIWAAFLYVITTSSIWSLLSILCSQFLKKTEDISLTSFLLTVMVISLFAYLLQPWNHLMLCCSLILGFTVLLFVCTLFVLVKREAIIHLKEMN